MISAGMNVARFNFSHGDYSLHKQMIASVRSAAKASGRTVTLLQDLQGPRIRTGQVAAGGLNLKNGAKVVLLSQQHYRAHTGEVQAIPIQYPQISDFVKAGVHIYIQDGLIDLQVTRVAEGQIYCRVVQGGVVGSHKGINVPGVSLDVPVITKKDRADLKFGVEQNMDYVALSFVKDASNIKALRRLLPKTSSIKIIAKIERAEAVDNFDEILAAADGIMVARGDLGVELGAAAVPLLQKEMIMKCLKVAKPVIVATQMLESMTVSPRPTRAEAADVANAVADHTDAIMLSAESATGKFPVKAVQTMKRIARTVELSTFDDLPADLHKHRQEASQTGMAHAAVDLAEAIGAKAIVAYTKDGNIAAHISQLRPQNVPIIVTSHNTKLLQQLNLFWGIHSATVKAPKNRADLIKLSRKVIDAEGIGKTGDLIVIIGPPNNKDAAVLEVVVV